MTECIGIRLDELKSDIVIFLDSSFVGLGITMNAAYVNGPRSMEHLGRHINEMELIAAFYALRAIVSHALNITINLLLDKAASIGYTYKYGGIHSTPTPTQNEKISGIRARVIAPW